MEVRHSEQIGKLTEALAKATLNFKVAAKDTKNPFYQSKYADLATLIDATRSALAAEGLVVMQFPFWEGSSVTLSTMLSHASGEFIAHDLEVPLAKQDAQGVGSGTTYARRYSYGAILNIAGEDDDDGNAAVGIDKKESTMPKPPARSAKPTLPLKPTNGEDSFAKNFWAAAKKTGKSETTVRNYLGSIGCEHTAEIKPAQYSEAMEWAEGE